MSPITFIKNPVLWIQLMSKHRVHCSIVPDFAFRLAARKFAEAKERGSAPALDLSSIEWLASSAEPVRPDTITLFESAFADCGLRQDWFGSGYGLAEHVAPATIHHSFALSEPRPEDGTKQYVSCGRRSVHEVHLDIKMVDPVTCEEVADGMTGEVWISGDSVTLGYYGKPEISEETFRAKLNGSGDDSATYLRTGDLGFFQGDFMFICGRIKDLLIVNGANYYPQDIEFVCQDASPAVRPGCVAAFASSEIDDEGSLEVVFEIRPNSVKTAKDICSTVRDAIVQHIGLTPSKVVAIAEKIPKTTSGYV